MKRIITLGVLGVTIGIACAQSPIFRSPKALQRKGYVPREMYPYLDKARETMHVDELHKGINIGGDLIPFTGKGVIIGIIDGGIDARHLAFRDRFDDTKSRAELVIKTESAQESKTGELVYDYHHTTTGELVSKTLVDWSVDGHGTHTAGCAAGGYMGNDYYGIAPDATLVLTTMGNKLYDDEIYFGIGATFDYARQKGMPCVASLSLGSVVGPHNGNGTLKEVLEEKMSDQGQAICFAAGNDGNMACHLERDFSTEPGELATGLYKASYMSYAAENSYIHLYSDSDDYEIAFSLLTYGESSEELSRTEWLKISDLPDDGNWEFISDWEDAKDYFPEDSYAVVGRVPESLGRRGIVISTETPASITVQDQMCALGILVRSESAHIEMLSEPSLAQFYRFANPNYVTGNNKDCISDLATADNVISVGALNHRDSYSLKGGNKVWLSDYFGNYEEIGRYSSFTDKKGGLPLVAAPGTMVISSMTKTSSYDQVASDKDSDGKEWLWGATSGTSMATPVMAGTIALWLQAKPDLTYAELLDIIEHCSTGVEPEYKSRYGVPSAYEGLKHILKNASINEINSDTTPRELMMRPLGDGRWEAVVPFATSGGDFAVYSAAGMICSRGNFDGGVFEVNLPDIKGVYVIDVITPQGRVTRKLQR